MQWLNRLARALVVLSAGGYIAIHAVARAHPAPGWDVGLYIAFGLAAGVALLTEPGVRQWRPTLHIGRRRGYLGAWVEPPTRRRWAGKRRLRERALDLERHIYDLAAEGMVYDPPPFQSAAWREGNEAERERLLEREHKCLG